MNLSKSVRCHIRLDSSWAGASAVCMGISVFVRTVFYFGLSNLRDLSGYELTVQVVLPMVVAAAYLILIRGLRLNSPVLTGVMMLLFAGNYLLLMDGSAPSVACGVLVVLRAALFLVTGLGLLPTRIPLIVLALVSMVCRLWIIDLNGWILPLSQFHPVEYLSEMSNLFGFLAIGTMCPALRLSPRRSLEKESASTAE